MPMHGLPGIERSTLDGGSTKREVIAMEYGLESFIDQCLEAYESLAGSNLRPYRRVATPFLPDEEEGEDSAGVLAPIALKVLMKVL